VRLSKRWTMTRKGDLVIHRAILSCDRRLQVDVFHAFNSGRVLICQARHCVIVAAVDSQPTANSQANDKLRSRCVSRIVRAVALNKPSLICSHCCSTRVNALSFTTRSPCRIVKICALEHAGA
jgi:hypothetical protein